MFMKLKSETKIKLLKTLIIVIVLAVIILAIYLPLELTGTLDKIDSAEKLQEIIQSGGAYSYLIFVLIQFLQTTFVPIPAAVTTIAGVLAFENIWIVFALSLTAVLLGSIFAFFLGYKIGRRLVFWVVGKKDAIKWELKLKRGKYVFFLMMLFPFFPDDILCLVAGCIGMSFRFFLITNIITRPIIILLTCVFGSGSIIPFSGWGIPVWIVLIVLGILAFYFSYKYQKQIENFIYRCAARLTGKKPAENANLPQVMILSQNNITNEKLLSKDSKTTENIKQTKQMYSLGQTELKTKNKNSKKRKNKNIFKKDTKNVDKNIQNNENNENKL